MQAGRLHFLFFSLMLMIGGLLLSLAVLSDFSVSYSLAFVFLVVCSIPYYLGLNNRDQDWFEPIYAISLLYFLYFGVYSIYILVKPNVPGRFGNYSPEGLDRALLYTILGFCCLLIGYHSPMPKWFSRHLPSLRIVPPGSRAISVVYITWSVGMVLRLYAVSNGWHVQYSAQTLVGSLPTYAHVVNYLAMLTTVGWMLGVIYCFIGGRSAIFTGVVWLVMFPAELIFTFFTGSKTAFFPILIMPFMAYHYFRHPIKLKLLLIPLLLMIFAVTPIITSLRGIDAMDLRTKGLVFGLNYAGTEIHKELRASSMGEYFESAYGTFMERICGSGMFSVVIDSVPDRMQFQYGKTIFIFVVLLVPTFLWPGKYDVYQGITDWGYRIFGLQGTGGISVTQIGELYLNFALVGVVFGMFLLGVFYRAAYLCLKPRGNPASALIYAKLWMAFLVIEIPFAPFFSNILKDAVILLVVVWFLNGGRLFETGGASAQEVSTVEAEVVQ
jgi:hypothetical protein